MILQKQYFISYSNILHKIHLSTIYFSIYISIYILFFYIYILFLLVTYSTFFIPGQLLAGIQCHDYIKFPFFKVLYSSYLPDGLPGALFGVATQMKNCCATKLFDKMAFIKTLYSFMEATSTRLFCTW